MKFATDKDFMQSLQALTIKGGKFGRAAAQVIGVLRLSQRKTELAEVFAGLVTTNHGESRIQHCTKYDLQGSCRLITVQHDGICLLLFAGDHDGCDEWLETNKGKRFHLKETLDGRIIQSTRVSESVTDPASRLQTVSDFSTGALWEKLPLRYFESMTDGLAPELVAELKGISSIVSDEELVPLACLAPTSEKSDLLYDVFDLLRGGLVQEAKARVDRYEGSVVPLEDASPAALETAVSGDEVMLVDDVDPVLFEHFVKTASYDKWMMYLHPSQRSFANKDFNGPTKLTGVSGSGKTSVLIHRAIRLARLYPEQKILVLTLNRALSRMIHDLVSLALGDGTPLNLEVKSFWELCREKLAEIEPHNRLLYTDKTVATNQFAVSEYIDDIWTEYYEQRNNNRDAKVLTPLHRTLLVRNIYPCDYIRQEFDYLRSALAPSEREQYLSLEREGRAIPLEERYRRCVIDGLVAWERKMTDVGAVDYLGLTTALYKHLEKLEPSFRCILVDEMQDFGSVELKIVRSLVRPDINDIFLSGDTAQSVLTKYHRLSDAGIDVVGRSHSIVKNYRNSREILNAASELFKRNKDMFASAPGIEILDPEFANFSSSPPLLLTAPSLKDEVLFALGHLHAKQNDSGNNTFKSCIAICGLAQSELEDLSRQIALEVLNGDTNVVAGKVFLSDLEQTKGFEFDSMIILNCAAPAIPHPYLPAEESYRELCKLYVAMTRAKRELIISYSRDASPFLGKVIDLFTIGEWHDYADVREHKTLTVRSGRFSAEPVLQSPELDGEAVLMCPEAVGLSSAAQEKLIQLVAGNNRFRGNKQLGWKTFDSFFESLRKSPALHTVNFVSRAMWDEFVGLHSRLALRSAAPKSATRRRILTLKR
ncbi:Superfamily I DNA and RNA helicase-like protein [Burkholderia sp. H160]|nr:Superfamily I DNA and RNA helicase-like protein [Burkholderia sp. H160]